jgi:hypothetical protein
MCGVLTYGIMTACQDCKCAECKGCAVHGDCECPLALSASAQPHAALDFVLCWASVPNAVTAAAAAAAVRVLCAAGDSRAVLGRKGSAVVLTSDHKASRDDEVQRVQVRA